jgi:hypothetical protein
LAPIISTPYFRQHAVLVQVERAVQRGLATHGRQHRIRALLGDDLLDHLPGDGLDVGDVGRGRVRHDRGRVAVHQDDLVALLAQRLAGLGAGIVELAGLADDDRAGADDEDAFQVGGRLSLSWHGGGELGAKAEEQGTNARGGRKTPAAPA